MRKYACLQYLSIEICVLETAKAYLKNIKSHAELLEKVRGLSDEAVTVELSLSTAELSHNGSKCQLRCKPAFLPALEQDPLQCCYVEGSIATGAVQVGFAAGRV